MGDILPFPAKPTTDLYFGGCPKCGQSDGCKNVGGNHYFVCDEHNAAWCIGYNLFSEWKDEPQKVHEANERKLRSMHIVEPIYPESDNNGAAA